MLTKIGQQSSKPPANGAQDALEEVCRHEWKMHLRVPFLQVSLLSCSSSCTLFDALLGSDAKADSEEDMKRLVANLRQSVHSQEERGDASVGHLGLTSRVPRRFCFL